MMNVAWYWWLLAGLLLALVEMTSVNLVFIMLAAGSIAGGITSLLTGSLLVQSLVAAIVAILMLLVVRPVALRHLRQPGETRTGTAALVGAGGFVIDRVDGRDGRVKIGGEVWSARTFDPSVVLEPGTPVEVVRIDGAHAVVYASEP
jgi:membrane protein implicated in regulation of membrane protease activity